MGPRTDPAENTRASRSVTNPIDHSPPFRDGRISRASWQTAASASRAAGAGHLGTFPSNTTAPRYAAPHREQVPTCSLPSFRKLITPPPTAAEAAGLLRTRDRFLFVNGLQIAINSVTVMSMLARNPLCCTILTAD